MTSWSQSALSKLEIRDEVEKSDSKYFRAFQELSERMSKVRKLEGKVEGKLDPQEQPSSGNAIDKINRMTFALERANNRVRESNSINKRLERENQSLRAKIDNMTMEINEKNKAIETINDEMLSCNIQNNVLTTRIEEVSGENETLIRRWMEKVGQDADKLNESNEGGE